MNASDLLVPADPLISAGAPERVNYATGVLLQADDFRDEQTYHRARLAQALRHLVGFGTVAGLAARAPEAEDNELHLRVEPGVAIDRFGRLVEAGESWCIRLANWVAAQETPALRAAMTPRGPAPIQGVLTVDLFLSARDCGRGKTPSFASGPFDALDALTPARMAEQPQFELVLRVEGAPDVAPAPANHWPGPSASAEDRLAAVLGSWEVAAGSADGSLTPLSEHVDGHDSSAVFLARITVPVSIEEDVPEGARPLLDLTRRVAVDNRARPFVYLPGKWLGRAPAAVSLVEP